MKRTRNAHTLLELLLATTILGIVLVALYSSFSMGIRVYQRVRNDVNKDVQIIFNQLSGELRCAYLFPEDDPQMEFIGTPTSLRFVTVTPLRQQTISPGAFDLKETWYYLLLGETGSMTLMNYKKAFAKVTGGRSSSMDPDKSWEERPLTRRVQSFRLSYFDGKEWRAAWSSGFELPCAVRITLNMRKGSDPAVAEPFTTVVEIPLYREPRDENDL